MFFVISANVNYHKPSNEGMWLLFNSSPDHDIKKLR